MTLTTLSTRCIKHKFQDVLETVLFGINLQLFPWIIFQTSAARKHFGLAATSWIKETKYSVIFDICPFSGHYTIKSPSPSTIMWYHHTPSNVKIEWQKSHHLSRGVFCRCWWNCRIMEEETLSVWGIFWFFLALGKELGVQRAVCLETTKTSSNLWQNIHLSVCTLNASQKA